jgi:hypothetical protein
MSMNGNNAEKTPAFESLPVLLGSTFPLSLIRRKVEIAPAGLVELRKEIKSRGVISFWGHANTLAAANDLLGVDVRPSKERPALHLSPEGLPELDKRVFSECWIISPNYVRGFRPAIGEEVSPQKISGWQVLRVEWISGGEVS